MFFTDEIIQEFREEIPEIKAYLAHHKKKLIHLPEIRDFILWTPDETKNLNDQSLLFVSTWTNKICGDGISDLYGAKSLMIALSSPEKQFDVIFVVDENYLEKLEAKDYTSSSSYTSTDLVNDKLNHVHSVMIVQKGECAVRPRTVAVRLICSRKTMKANILMGAYLYTIKKKGGKVDQTGILELADGFKNLPGYCLYTKFGFKEDKSLYVPVLWKNEKGYKWHQKNQDKDLWVPDPTNYDFKNLKQKRMCFGNQENLPMSVDLTNITEQAIIKTTTKGKPIRKKNHLLQKSASAFQLKVVPKPRDLCTSLKANTEEERIVQKAIAGLYSKVHNTELDIENNAFYTGQILDDSQMKLKKQNLVAYKNNINTLRSTFKQNPRHSVASSSFFSTTRKSRPPTTINYAWSSTDPTKKQKTRTKRSTSPHTINSLLHRRSTQNTSASKQVG